MVRIGHFTSMAADIEFLPAGNHRTDAVTTFPIRQLLCYAEHFVDAAPSRGDAVVGNDVWIGQGARIVGPVNIGHGAVVGAYSVVTKDVEPYTLVAGAPAVVKRRRFADHIIEDLIRISWWDWSDELIISRAEDLTSNDVEAFVAKYG